MLIAIVQGPNLNLLGTREPHLYGSTTLDALHGQLRSLAGELGVDLSTFQSNHEGALVDHLHTLRGVADGIVINAAAYTHTSIALRDALSAIAVPFVEVHLSNVYAREPFRHHSLLADKAIGVISGLGPEGYSAALRFLVARASKGLDA
jgi:3-dehydroquinate dehydratase-2